MADTLESLEIKVVHNASGADAEINGVATAIGRLKTALVGAPAALKELATAVKSVNEAFKGGTAKYDKFAESLTNVAAAAEMLGEHSKDVSTLATAMNTMSEVKVTAGSFNALAKGVENVANAAKGITADAIANLDKMVTSLAKLQGIDLQGLGAAMSAVRRGGSVTPKEPPIPVPDELRELIRNASAIDVLEAKLVSLRAAMEQAFNAGDLDKAYGIRNQILQTEAALEKARAAAEKAGKATKEAGRGIKEMSKEASKSKSPLDNLISSLKRIAFYRFIRSIIKSITQAFQEGLQNAYAFSSGIASEGHRFAAALDSMSTAGLTMKNQLGSAFIGLLAAIAPIINAIISLVTRLANILSQLFAAFTGTTYLKAAEVPKKWADGAGGAAKAAKEWRNQLLGFDEINRLEEPNDPNGGGGGGALDPMSMFEDTPIDGIFKKMRDKLIELKESLNFEPLIESWNRLKESVKALGETILSGLAWAWENILVPLAHWTIEQLAPTLVNLLASAFDFLRAVLEALAPVFDWLWQNIMKPLFEFIGTVAIGALSGLNKLLKDLADLISGEISFVEFIKGLTGSEYAIGLVVAILGGMGLIGLLKELDMFIRTSLFLSIGKLNTLFAFFAANPAVAVVAAIAAIIFVCIELVQHWEEIKQKLSELKDKFASTWGDGKIQAADFAYAVVVSLQTIIGWIETAIGWVQSLISWLRGLDSMSISPNVSAAIANDRFTGGNYYASGGHPSEGEIFVARENGPEMVGMMGGRTTVATNADIVEGIRQGVFEAVSAAMNGGQNDVNVRVYLDSREIKVGQNRLNRAMGVG